MNTTPREILLEDIAWNCWGTVELMKKYPIRNTECWQYVCDPMDEHGFVHLPDGPGLGFDFNWDYINDNRLSGPEMIVDGPDVGVGTRQILP